MFLFISTGEVVFLLFAVLMLFGTDRLPGFARSAAKLIKQVRNATNDIKSDIAKAADLDGDSVEEFKRFKDSVKEIEDTVKRK